MDAAVIIGFSYSKSLKFTDRPFIPGILIDIYHAYKYVRSLIAGDNIIIITDIIADLNIEELRTSITNSVVGTDILNFVTEMRNQGYFRDYISKEYVFKDISEVLKGSKKIFLYYTGHAIDGCILLPLMTNEICYRYDSPKDSIITFSSIRDSISEKSLSNSKILIILDCCNANGLELPYKLIGKVYRLINKTNKVYPRQKFICFSASTIDESSVASRHGSIFSHIFFKYLKEKRNIWDLLVTISDECSKKYSQTVTVHSSYPDLKMIWRWLCFKDKISIKLNSVENYFIIKEKE